MREIRTLGAVRAKAEWLSYSTLLVLIVILLKVFPLHFLTSWSPAIRRACRSSLTWHPRASPNHWEKNLEQVNEQPPAQMSRGRAFGTRVSDQYDSQM